jgi:hypothetical protein
MKSDDGAVPPSNNIIGFSHQCSIRICHSPWGEQSAYQPAYYPIAGTWFGIKQQPSQPFVTFFLYKISRNAKNTSLECTMIHAAILFLCPCIPTILLSADGSRDRAGEDLQRRKTMWTAWQSTQGLPTLQWQDKPLPWEEDFWLIIYDTLNHAFNK